MVLRRLEHRARLGGRGRPRAQPGAARSVRAFEALASVPEKTLAVFFDLHPYLAQVPELVRTVRDALPTAKATQRPLLFCSPELTVPVEWEKDVAVLDYPLPSRAALSGLWTSWSARPGSRCPPTSATRCSRRPAG